MRAVSTRQEEPASRLSYFLLRSLFFLRCPSSLRFVRPSAPSRRLLSIRVCFRTPHPMAARILANLLVAGSMVVGRAVVQAYQKAIQNANKTGVAHEALNNIQRARKAMTEQEARLVLGIGEQTTWEEVLQKYDVLFEKNAKNGSFYLQSKVHRAKECLESVYQSKGEQPSSQH